MDSSFAAAHINALTGNADAVMDFRAIHDVNKAVEARQMRGTLTECIPWMIAHQQSGFGIHVVVNELDGNGRKLENVTSIRAHFVDLDNDQAVVNYQRASIWQPSPSFVVYSSPTKYHVYWLVKPYADKTLFSLIQRKLIRLFDSDKGVVDATRTLRLAGSHHLKNPQAPHMVTCHALNGLGTFYPVEVLQEALGSIELLGDTEGHIRHPLGAEHLSASSKADVIQCLWDNPSDQMPERSDWLFFTACWKQAVWLHMPEEESKALWHSWCSTFEGTDVGANEKVWRSITETTNGWPYLKTKSPSVIFGSTPPPLINPDNAPPAMPAPQAEAEFSEVLYPQDLEKYFAGCYRITGTSEIYSPRAPFGTLNQSAFNTEYDGKRYVITSDAVGGGMVKHAWEAATNGTIWRTPSVDELRFRPDKGFQEIGIDTDGVRWINTFRSPFIPKLEGDVSIWVDHVHKFVGNHDDAEMLIAYMAHNIKFPGYKIPWAPFIQSTQGAGKGAIMKVMPAAFNKFCYSPTANEITSGGSKFNAWMRNKLFFSVQEIVVHEDRREVLETLKLWISEERVETQGKGTDQRMADNCANWAFESNWKNAIPVTADDRRYMVIFSPLQTNLHLLEAGMDEDYFRRLYDWLQKEQGFAKVINYLANHRVERNTLPTRAPKTQSSPEAWKISQSPLERMISEAVEEGAAGFRGGFIGLLCVRNRIRVVGSISVRTITDQTIQSVLEKLGYVDCGLAPRAYFPEGRNAEMRSRVFHIGKAVNPEPYGRLQGWE